MNRSSIKATTLIFSVSGMLVVSLIALIIFNELITNWFSKEYDSNLEAKIKLMQTLTEFDDEGLEFEFSDEIMREYSREKSPEYFQIWIDRNTIFERSKSLGTQEIEFIDTELDRIMMIDSKLPDGGSGRVAYIKFRAHIDMGGGDDDHDQGEKTSSIDLPIVSIAIAMERESLDEVIYSANLILLVSFLFILSLSSLVVWWSVKRGLKPLDELQNKVASINYGKAGEYLKLSQTPQELTLLVDKFNLLIDNVRDKLEQEQQFSSDIAHELKTPIAEIITISEVALVKQDEQNPLYPPLLDIIDVSFRMDHLVSQLLLLARRKILLNSQNYQVINIETTISNCIKTVDEQIKNRKLALSIQIEGLKKLLTSQLEFNQIVCNLISNSTRYSNTASEIHIKWHCFDDQFSFSVSNLTGNLEQTDLAYLFKRLWIKDKARTDTKCSGIGLSLVKSYCDLLQFNISTTLENQYFTITISGIVPSNKSSN